MHMVKVCFLVMLVLFCIPRIVHSYDDGIYTVKCQIPLDIEDSDP